MEGCRDIRTAVFTGKIEARNAAVQAQLVVERLIGGASGKNNEHSFCAVTFTFEKHHQVGNIVAHPSSVQKGWNMNHTHNAELESKAGYSGV